MKKLLILILCLVPVYAEATVHLYVNTDTGGLKSCFDPGANACSQLNWAIAKIPAQITESYIIHVKGSKADTRGVYFPDKGSTSANTITIQTDPADRHSGKWDETKYRLEITDTNGFTINGSYIYIDGLQMKLMANTAGYKNLISTSSTARGTITVSNSIFWGVITPGLKDTLGFHGNRNHISYLYNNIFYGFNGAGDHYAMDILAEGYVYNNTTIDCDIGIRAASNDNIVAKNNVFINPRPGFSMWGRDSYVTEFAAGSDYNSTNDTTLGYVVHGGYGGHDKVGISTLNLFKDAANHDYHWNQGATQDVLRSGVVDPGASLFSTDIDGTTRLGPWDRGADQIDPICY